MTSSKSTCRCLVGCFSLQLLACAPSLAQMSTMQTSVVHGHTSPSSLRFLLTWEKNADEPVILSSYRGSKIVSRTRWHIFSRFYEFHAVALKNASTIFIYASSETGQFPQNYIWKTDKSGKKPQLMLTLTQADLRSLWRGRTTERSVARWVDNPPLNVKPSSIVIRKWQYSSRKKRFSSGGWKVPSQSCHVISESISPDL